MASIFDKTGVTPVMIKDFLNSDYPTKIKALRNHVENFISGLTVKTDDVRNIATVHAEIIGALEVGSEEERQYLAMKSEGDALVAGIDELIAQQIEAATTE